MRDRLRSLFTSQRPNKLSADQQAALVEWAKKVEALPPCPDPHCIAARQEIRDICAGKPAR